jgi:coenzyme F420-reducing hydrogenase alpha subunit
MPEPPATTSRTIRVGALARVEGEGALAVRVRDGRVEQVQFRIYEPPRLFEALLRGRMFGDAPDITSRICGICPIAYVISACQGVEAALAVDIPPALADLRRLVYCGEWIQSHVLHATMLHAPDFLGLSDVFELARAMPRVVGAALRLKQLGNRVLEVVGGRAVHPVNLRVGGFYQAPEPAAVAALIQPLRRGIDEAVELARAFAAFDFPDYRVDCPLVSLHRPDAYAIADGRIVSDDGLDLAVAAFPDHFVEDQVDHSTALHGGLADGRPYLVGPLARYSNNFSQLSDLAKETARSIGLAPGCRNPFRSILVRMVEVVYACEEALRLAEAYVPPAPAAVAIEPAAGVGHGASEAPRGLLYHRYRLDPDGRIEAALIVPPTSQNQKQIEADLKAVVEDNLDLADRDLTWRCEQTIRNHDPCISCATHFLDLRIERD